MIVIQSNVIKVKKKTFTRYIGVAKIFDWRGEPNRKTHAMTLPQVFKKRDFLCNKDIVKWRIRSQGLGWHVTRILLKRKDLNQKLKNFPKLFKLGKVVTSEQTCLTQTCYRLGYEGLPLGDFFVILGGNIAILIPFGSYFALFESHLK